MAAWSALWAWLQSNPSGLSWHFFVSGSHLLFDGAGLNLYAEHPELQIGPLAFLVAAPLTSLGDAAQPVALILMTAAGPLCLTLIAPLAPDRQRHLRVFLAAIVLMPAWTVLSVRFGHLDDVVALVLAVGALRAIAANRAAAAGLALGAAVAAKPWALGFIPLLLVLDKQRLAAAGSALAGVIAAWAPFIIANPATLAALRPPVGVAPSSGLHALGYRGDLIPAWDRVGQFVLAPIAALAPVLRGRWPGLFLVAVAVRLAMDPKDNPYYIGGAALAAVIFDLLATRWTIPWATLITILLLWQPWATDYAHRLKTSAGVTLWWFQNPGIIGILHLGWSATMIALVLFAPQELPSLGFRIRRSPGAGRVSRAPAPSP
ncbi:MAG TPA: hypothetical protein VJT14_09545 [Candidatus Dormibacteraeota bacterium]|nr:hypothetical protein [Candidatus Dormibacteraeota bacterium]